MLLWVAAMSTRKPPTFSQPRPSNLQSHHGRIPASGSEGQRSGAHAEEGRFEATPVVAAHQHPCQGAECGANPKIFNGLKSGLDELMKKHELSHFRYNFLKGKEIDV
jgi:hypothetical protein